ncbi:MAG: NAD(P)H-flavin oxidoreductase [Planctomycetaceae bacterium]|nr:MAG: NAD(P)H-flavin oxidoreductase [Planctomycetaceae bacterium]
MERRQDGSSLIHSILAGRWSPVSFQPRTIEPEILARLFEAARWSPSSYNDQPWSYIIATREQEAEFARLLSCLMELNQVWAQHASVLGLSCAQKLSNRTGQPNRYAWHDTGMANLSLAIQAQAEGLYVHFMGGFDVQRARHHLEIPPTHDPVVAFAIGYYDPTHRQLPPEVASRDHQPRQRKPLCDMVFNSSWGQPWQISRPS